MGLEDEFVNGFQGIDGGRETRPMDAEIVVFVSMADITGVLNTSVTQNGNKRSRQDFDLLPVLFQFVCFQRQLGGNIVHEFVEIACVALTDDFINDCRQGNSANICQIHADAWNDKLPAGRNGIVSRILQFVSMSHKAWNHDVVIGILWEAEPLFGKLRRLLKYLNRRVMSDSQIDFRID